ncbi:protein of unknown function (plasmid) [Streptantibioticus cattleyicolor NRRL 8057 = DSM 46488]|nr:protein of unknown function [Streptantibioticus cattleyicolor NRRL 8057 = DSM 46488]
MPVVLDGARHMLDAATKDGTKPGLQRAPGGARVLC